MSQSEVIQALRNLGNVATRDDLIIEYFKLHYTDPSQRSELTAKNYKIGNCLAPYLSKLRKQGVISSKLVITEPGQKNEVVYTLLLDPEHVK